MQHPSTCQCEGSGKIGDWEKEFDAIEQCGTECGFSCGGGCPDKVKSFIYALQERHEAEIKRLREVMAGVPYKENFSERTEWFNRGANDVIAAFDSTRRKQLAEEEGGKESV